MNDPHVELLEYRLVPRAGAEFVIPPSVTMQSPDLAATLAHGKLTVKMLAHFVLELVGRY